MSNTGMRNLIAFVLGAAALWTCAVVVTAAPVTAQPSNVVYVLNAMTSSGNWVPTLQFSSLEKCEKAADSFVVDGGKHLGLGKPTQPWCWRVEK